MTVKFPKTCKAWSEGRCKFNDEDCYFCHQVFVCFSFFYTGECKFGAQCQNSHEFKKKLSYVDLNQKVASHERLIAEQKEIIKNQLSTIQQLKNQTGKDSHSEQLGKINDMASPLVVQIKETVTKPTISEHKLVLATSSIPVPRNVDKTKGTDTHFEVGSIALNSTEEYWQTKSGDKQISPSSKSHEISMRREDSNKNKSGTKSQKSDLGQSTHKYTIDRLCPYFFGSPFRPGSSCKWGSDCYYKHVLTIAGEVYIPQKNK